MKKSIAAILLSVLAFGAFAEPSAGYANSGWLYWTLDFEDDWGNVGLFDYRADKVDAGTYDVWLVADNDHGTKYYFRDSTYPESITLDDAGMGNIGEFASEADLSVIDGDLSDYLFYSELGTYSALGNSEVLWRSYRREYDSLSGFIQDSQIDAADIWNTAVSPEPTSGLLLLLGLAGLALRRRKKS